MEMRFITRIGHNAGQTHYEAFCILPSQLGLVPFGCIKLWLCISAGRLNDLWEYTMAAKEWNWISGSNTANNAGNYGTKGIPGTSVVPPSRYGSSCAVDPVSGDLIVFGGLGSSGPFNDVFRYSFSTSMWTWISGTNTGNSPGTPGTIGVADTSNAPPGLLEFAMMNNKGTVYIYGGLDPGKHIPFMHDFVPNDDRDEQNTLLEIMRWTGTDFTLAVLCVSTGCCS
jgi:hypothetical protein